MVRAGLKALAAGAAATALYQQLTFVPAPQAQSRLPVAAGVGAAATIAAAPAFADQIGDAAAKLTDAAYPFVKDVDWNTYLYMQNPSGAPALDWLKAVDKAIVMGAAMDSKLLKAGVEAHHKAIGTIGADGVLSKQALTDVDAAIGRLIASVPESMTLDVYNTFKSLTGADAANYLMSTVKEADAKQAQAGLMAFKDVVKANPITPSAPGAPSVSAAKLGAIDAAAKKLAAGSYPFIQDVDWTSQVYLKPLPGVQVKEALGLVDKMLVMGASMDGKLLKEAAEAHHKAIGSVDAKGVTSAADWEAVNAALGKLIASVPQSQVMDVYNVFAKALGNGVVANNMFAFSTKGDAIGAYKAFLEFKDVVKSA